MGPPLRMQMAITKQRWKSKAALERQYFYFMQRKPKILCETSYLESVENFFDGKKHLILQKCCFFAKSHRKAAWPADSRITLTNQDKSLMIRIYSS